MNKRLKFLGLDVLYSLSSVIIAGLCSLVQCIALKKLDTVSGYDILFFDMQFNPLAYIAGTVLFLLFFYYSYKRFLIKKYKEYPVNHPAVIIMHFIISVVFAFAMFIVLIFASLLLIGFDKNLVPELLAFITIFVWPGAFIVYMNATLAIYLIGTRKIQNTKKKKK